MKVCCCSWIEAGEFADEKQKGEGAYDAMQSCVKQTGHKLSANVRFCVIGGLFPGQYLNVTAKPPGG